MSTRDTAWPAGTPCWVDYAARDIGAAQAFYGELLGWTFTDGQPEYGGYLTCLRHDLAAAGMMPTTDAAQPPGWTTYFAADDAAAVSSAITAGGGSILVPPMQVGAQGTMVLATDPAGMVFGLWQSGEHTGARLVNEPGGVVWNEEAVSDPDVARAFYGAVFGFRFEPVEGAPGYTTFATADRPLGGLGGLSEGVTPGWSTCFAVVSADEASSYAERAGGQVPTPPADMPYGRFAVLSDPWGAVFSVMQLIDA